MLKIYGSVADLTAGGGGTVSDGIMTTMMSDRRVKENIVEVGRHPLGIGLYLFDYKEEFHGICGAGRQFGVMADEVEAVVPEAVSAHAAGFKQVNYALLGINRHLN